MFAYYWSDTSNWRIQASLTDNPGGDLPLYIFSPLPAGGVQYYTGADATVDSSSLAPNPFTTAVRIAEGNRRLLQTPLLGQVTGTSFSVYIDDSSMQVDQNERTWYDGIGYELIPEPTAALLLVVGIGGLMLGRRNGRAETEAV